MPDSDTNSSPMPDHDANKSENLEPEQSVLAPYRGLAPGWYRDSEDPALARYWDGVGLSTERQPVGSGSLEAAAESAPNVAGGADAVTSEGRFRAAQSGSVRKARRVLVAVLLGFVVLATVIALKTPAYESADEPSHVRNIETLVSGHWYGMSSKCHYSFPKRVLVDCSGTEAHQAPLYYLLLAGWQRAVGIRVQTINPGPVRFNDKQGLFVHHSTSTHRFLLWLRFPNVLLGALTILFTFLAIRTLTSDPWTPVLGAAIVAFWPRFVFLSAFVTNDNLVDLLGAVLTFLSLRYLMAPSRGRLALVAGACGLLVITKLSALPVAIVVVLVIPLFRRPTPKLVSAFLLGIGSFIGVCGWYLVQNTVRYGDPLASRASRLYLAKVGGLGTSLYAPYHVTRPLDLIFARVPIRIWDGFWYTSGWNQFRWPFLLDLVFWVVFAWALYRLLQRGGESRVQRPLWFLGVLAALSLLCVWIVAFQTSTYEARIAFVGLAAFACLASLGLERLKLSVRLVFPALCFLGTVYAINHDVLSVHWT